MCLYHFALLVSNRVGLWYNLQLINAKIKNENTYKFQTELVCGIICNARLGIAGLFSYMFQTELVCGIICNKAIGGGVVASLNSFKPSWFVA